MSPDRNKRPAVQPIEHIEYTLPETTHFEGGSRFFTTNGGEQEVVKLDFAVKAGSWYENNKLQSLMSAAMLTEGTATMKATEIADKIDFYGAQFNSVSYYDNNYLSLVVLKRHLPKLLPVMADMLQNSVFPANEFEIIRQQRKQRAQVDAERVGLVAQRRFLQEMFGPGHPYTPVKSPDAYDHISIEGTIDHYRNTYGSGRMNIYGSGHIDNEVKALVSEYFGKSWGAKFIPKQYTFTPQAYSEPLIFLEKDTANQNAMTIGKLFPTQTHPDSAGLKVLTTVLGGYFGSRLMTNLREEKGLTYSIHASSISFIHEAIFMIHAEVAAGKTDEAVKETFAEIEKLRQEPISETELEPLRSYLLGRMLEEFDGPFARSQSFASLHEAGLDYNYYDLLIDTIRYITPEEIMQLAQRYFDPKSMLTVVAGAR